MKRARSLLPLAALAATLAALAWGFYPGPVEVDVAGVVRGPLRVTVDREGKTRVKDRYVVSAPLAGRLLRLDLRPGDPVRAGRTLLAVIEPAAPALLDARSRSEAEARLEARAALREAAAGVERSAAVHEWARANLERLRKLRAGRTASEEEFEQAAAMARAMGADVRSREFALRVAEFERDQAQAALARSQPAPPADPTPGPAPPGGGATARFDVPAPVSGVVLRTFQESATVVAPGTRLLEVGDPADLECEADVLSADAVRIRPGQRAALEHWGGGHPLEARVRLVEPSAFTRVSALGVEEQRVNVILDLTDPPGRRPGLGDGYRVEARVVVWEKADALKAPSGALFRHGGGWAAFRVERGRAVPRPVEVGQDNGLEAEVLAGLDEGDRLVLHPGDRVRAGVRVAPRPEEH